MKQCTKLDDILNKYCTKKQKEWLWFIILWCVGFSAVSILGFVIRKMMGL